METYIDELKKVVCMFRCTTISCAKKKLVFIMKPLWRMKNGQKEKPRD